jgi:deoxyribodipyrimidine photo-lyase
VQRAYRERQHIAAMAREARPIELQCVDSLIARLHWHCHFIQKLESEPEIEHRAVHPLFEAHRLQTAPDDPRLVAWISGQTGFPFVDACMRSLIATGWINFRMRAMLVAFASYHLALDWRVSGARLARLFTDYEPGIHWPQVQMQSGQTGINTPRIYNPVKQSTDQDPDGVFIRRWVPELRELPLVFLHEPWRMSDEDQAANQMVLGVSYPHRIIDHVEAAKEARARLGKVRQLAGFHAAAKGVYQKHGSRKRTPTDDHPARTKAINARKADQAVQQMTLNFSDHR